MAAVLSVFARLCERFIRESKTARDATSDPAVLRRAGGRIRDWVYSRRVGSRKQSDSDRP